MNLFKRRRPEPVTFPVAVVKGVHIRIDAIMAGMNLSTELEDSAEISLNDVTFTVTPAEVRALANGVAVIGEATGFAYRITAFQGGRE